MVDATQQLESLLADPAFQRLMRLLTREVMATWNMGHDQASGVVLSAMGEPADLAVIHTAWSGNRGLAKVVLRRRALDQLIDDARPKHHVSLLDDDDGEPSTGDDVAFGITAPQGALITQLADHRLIADIRDALACFATQGPVERRQAELLQRYDLDERSYEELCIELACKRSALRVRVFKARAALLRHIRGCHPELEALLDAASWAHST